MDGQVGSNRAVDHAARQCLAPHPQWLFGKRREKNDAAAAAPRSSGKVSTRPIVRVQALWTVWEWDTGSG